MLSIHSFTLSLTTVTYIVDTKVFISPLFVLSPAANCSHSCKVYKLQLIPYNQAYQKLLDSSYLKIQLNNNKTIASGFHQNRSVGHIYFIIVYSSTSGFKYIFQTTACVKTHNIQQQSLFIQLNYSMLYSVICISAFSTVQWVCVWHDGKCAVVPVSGESCLPFVIQYCILCLCAQISCHFTVHV